MKDSVLNNNCSRNIEKFRLLFVREGEIRSRVWFIEINLQTQQGDAIKIGFIIFPKTLRFLAFINLRFSEVFWLQMSTIIYFLNLREMLRFVKFSIEGE